ncbi:MAG: acetoacetate decarboxylase family protein [Desulfatibacillum sp.]|nr:acetoacetate decarboxylase family protein [Desulfatibacillum sp.]
MPGIHDDRHYLIRLRGMSNKMFKSGNMWDKARFITANVPLDPKAVREILPRGMRPADPATGMLFIVDYPKTSFDVAYKEAALMVDVKTPLGRGVHCCWMVVDDETALIYGRECLGYPKKMAKFEFREEDGKVFGSITRRGVTALTLEGTLGQAQSAPEPLFAKKTFNVGGIGQMMAINPIWLFKPKEVFHESYALDVSVKIEYSEFDPLAALIAGPAISGRFVVMDIPGSDYMFPVGVAGLRFYANTAALRYK